MNMADTIKQAQFPTVMVPQREDLEPCETGKARLLMARDGLYLEAKPIWGRFIAQLWKSPRALPYGMVGEMDGFMPVLKQIGSIVYGMFPDAVAYAGKGLEWAGQIAWSEERGFYYQPRSFAETGPEHVKYEKQLPRGVHLVADVHSHHTMTPYFSDEDDRDDKGRIKISITLGNYNPERPIPFDYVMRYCVSGFFFQPKP